MLLRCINVEQVLPSDSSQVNWIIPSRLLDIHYDNCMGTGISGSVYTGEYASSLVALKRLHIDKVGAQRIN